MAHRVVREEFGVTKRGLWRGLAGVLLVLGCGPGPEGERGAGAAGELASSLSVQVAPDSVRLVLQVTNSGPAAVELEFGTAERYDFAVLAPDGAEVWRWSEGRAFAQVVGSERLAPGGTLRYEAWWAPAGRRGRFVAVGTIPAVNGRIEQRTEFEVGGS